MEVRGDLNFLSVATYRAWILETIRQIWHVFDNEFRQLWVTEGNKDEWASAYFTERYMAQLLEDALGFAAAEMFRRTIGLAWVDDFVGIADLDTRASAERLTLTKAEAWLLKRGRI